MISYKEICSRFTGWIGVSRFECLIRRPGLRSRGGTSVAAKLSSSVLANCSYAFCWLCCDEHARDMRFSGIRALTSAMDSCQESQEMWIPQESEYHTAYLYVLIQLLEMLTDGLD